MQMEKESKLKIVRERAAQVLKYSAIEIAKSNYGREGRFVNRASHEMHSQKILKPFLLSIACFFSSDDPKDMTRDCPQPLSLAEATDRHLEYNGNNK